MHRVRKNFVNYRREDDPEGMVRYLNRYYAGELNVGYEEDFLKIRKLKKSKIRGVESRGMLLAAEEGGTITLVTLDRDAGAGAKVR